MIHRYAELNARSAFSFLRGASSPEDLAAQAARLGIEALALADHGGFAGSPRAHSAAREHGIRPIVGCTVEIADPASPRPCHLPLLCMNRRGYADLCRFLTDRQLGINGNTDGSDPFLPLPRSPGNLIALTGDLDGPVARALLRGDKRGALLAATRLIDSFGKHQVVVTIQRHRLRGEERLNRLLIELAEHLGLMLAASNAPLHATRDGRMLADAFCCLRENITLPKAGTLLTPNAERHLRHPREIHELFADLPHALTNTLRVAERCAFTLENLGYRFPDWHDASGHPLSLPEQTTLLRRLAYQGAATRYHPPTPAVRRQIEHEIAMIHRLGFSGYFLIVHDIVLFARGRGILCQGRGSAANSAVCFALGITHVDPVGCGLLFERFLSENRSSWPDIDIDFPSGPRREEVIRYVFHKYGARNAAMTANVITYRHKSAFREMAKVLELPQSLADQASLTGNTPWDPSLPVAESGKWQALRTLYEAALGLPRHLGQHSGGMIICDAGLDAIVPLQPSAMPGRNIVQWDKDDCEGLGIVKVDLLGLGMLAAMETSLALCAKHGHPVDPARIPKDDPQVYDMLCRADTIGTFQVESRAQMATLPLMRPACFYDLAIEVAIIRPGPIAGGLLHPYLDRRNGRRPVDHIHPALEPVLRRTLGVPLFQEQVLRMAMTLAGFTGAEADELRRAMGAKQHDERMRRMTAKLRQRMTERSVPATVQEQVVNSIGSFALYGFPESHAISFALIAYTSCWLKVHRTAEFFAGLINHQPMGFYPVNTLLQDAARHGVRTLPVCCAHSEWETTVTAHRTLRLGLHRLKGLSRDAASRILRARAQRPFTSVRDLVLRASPDRAERRLLAAAGALDAVGTPKHRREALWQVERDAQDDLFSCMVAEDAPPAPLPEMDAAERLAADLSAQDCTTGPHPLSLWRARSAPCAGPRESVLRAADLESLADHAPVTVAGLVICIQRPSTAKGNCFVSLEDESGIANLFLPKSTFDHLRLVLVSHPLLLAHGILQRPHGGQCSVKVHALEPLPAPETMRPTRYSPVWKDDKEPTRS